MIEVKECRISPIGDGIDLWVKVINGPAYKNIYISKIAIVDQNHYVSSYPEDNIILEWKRDDPDGLNIISNPKEFKMCIRDEKLDLKKNFYFVYVQTTGEVLDNYCDCGNKLEILAAINMFPIYQTKINLLHDYVEKRGANGQALIDLSLKEELFVQSIKLREYGESIDMWNNLINYDIERGNYKCSIVSYDPLYSHDHSPI